MRAAGDQIEAAVLSLDAFDLPALGLLVGDGGQDSDTLDLIIANHHGQAGRGPLGVRQDPGVADALDVADGALALALEVCQAALVKAELSLAIYWEGLPVHMLLRVTVRLVVEEAPLLMAKELTAIAVSFSVIVSLTAADSAPAAFRTLK